MKIKIKLGIAFFGNLVDIVSTWILTQTYGFYEINPIMRWLLQWPILAMIAKFFIISGILVYIFVMEKGKYRDILATLACSLYGALSIYYFILFLIYF